MPTTSPPTDWSQWRQFPDPTDFGILLAPIGPGVYELRLRSGQLVLFGCGKNVALRMTSLLPSPFGQGTRKNTSKRRFVQAHLADIEYRCLPCRTKEEAQEHEKRLKKLGPYVFKT